MFGMDKRKIQRISKMRVTKISFVKHPATQEPPAMLKSAVPGAVVVAAPLSPALAPASAAAPETMAAWSARMLDRMLAS